MARKAKPKYIQLEPAAFLSDEDFQMMDATERGIYTTLIFYMLCNNGRIKNDLDGIKRLCNVNGDFKPKWDSVKSKFYPKRAWLRHRRVDYELRKARERMQTAVISGHKGAEVRWGGHSNPNSKPIAKVSKGKVSKVKIKKSSKRKKFTPPTLQEITEYIQEKKYNVNPRKFYRHYAEADPPWTNVKGRPVKCWKRTMVKVWVNDDEVVDRSCRRSGCKAWGVYTSKDDTGQVCWWCEAHKPKQKTHLPDELLNPVGQTVKEDKRSTSDKVNVQRKALGIK